MSNAKDGYRRLGLRVWSRLLGIPLGTLKVGRSRFGWVPTGSLPEGLGLAAFRAARTRGAGLIPSGNLLVYLSDQSAAALEKLFASGRTHVLIVGEQLLCKLVRPEDVLDNPVVQANLPDAWAAGLMPTLIDVQSIWRRIKDEVAKLDAPAEAEEPGVAGKRA